MSLPLVQSSKNIILCLDEGTRCHVENPKWKTGEGEKPYQLHGNENKNTN